MEPRGVKKTIHLVFSMHEEGYLLGMNSSQESCILHGMNIKASASLSITSFSRVCHPLNHSLRPAAHQFWHGM